MDIEKIQQELERSYETLINRRANKNGKWQIKAAE